MPIMNVTEEMVRLRDDIARACAREPSLAGAVPVFGHGPVPCDLMVVGEAPGRDETRLGLPFVGKAGQFLTTVLKDVFSLEREAFYITNVVKVWPTIETKRRKTRKPSKAEEALFIPFLEREIELVSPKVIIAVGKTAFAALAPEADFTPGAWVERGGLSIMPVYHPAYLLRRQKSLAEETGRLKVSLTEVKERI